jgi:hypothetical protein
MAAVHSPERCSAADRLRQLPAAHTAQNRDEPVSGRQTLIIKRLIEEGQKSAGYFRGLNDASFGQKVYDAGPGWTVRDVLAHFVSAENTIGHYGRQILAGGSGAPEDFVIDEFNATQVAGIRGIAPHELVNRFEAARSATVSLVQSMEDADLDRIGRHPWFGMVPLENMLKLVYRHNMLHERDVRKALETGHPAPPVDSRPVSD